MRYLVFASAVICAACPKADDAPNGLKTAAEFCARITGCLDMTMDGCTSLLVGFSGFPELGPKVLQRCIETTESCDELGRCLNADQSAQACEPSEAARRCEGTVGRKCVGGVWLGFDCEALGLSCLQDSVGQIRCGRPGECQEGECYRSGIISCVNQVMAYQRCGNGSCINVDGRLVCEGEGPPCDVGDFRCEDDIAVFCQNGKEQREQCPSCSDGDRAYCGPDTQCDRSSCDENILLACIQGVPVAVDCVVQGFSGCADEADGAEEARCSR